MNTVEVKQEIINELMRTKATKTLKLKNCLKSNANVKEKAYCANQLANIYSLTDDDAESSFEAVKYYHIAYELQRDNSVYRDNACLHTFASIIKYSVKDFSSEVEAEGVLRSLNVMNKCEKPVFSWQEAGVIDDYMIARAANNLGMFYYKREQTKDNLEKAKQCFEIAYKPETHLQVIYGGNLAAVYFKLGEINKSIPLYEKCLQAEITEDFSKAEKANCAGALGLISLEGKAYEQALIFSKLAHHLAPNDGYYMNNLASSYLVTNQYDEAEYYFEKCSQAALNDHFTEATRENCYKGLEMLEHLKDVVAL